ncbi:GMC oxidoreductase [Laccaria amethystina LaAM-08-1]|uniref:GMC oxidoreductase n=1 Tax=Laccaria amethystina LaAM-08-1 TaxID=1095629 RepID=A0A0C9WGK8_9AGAR|nr:GMC oxidoreductase [Laccaria amethystina LaAM-08-1]
MEPGQHVRRNEEKGNFTPSSPRVQSVVKISYDASTHKSGGPMQVSYPAVIINITANWTSALADAGYSTLETPNGGVTMGAFITPSSINPANWTRSYLRSAYIDSLPPPTNAVEFMNLADNKLATISVRREAILAGGSLGTPKILLHSGVGPKDVLDAGGVPLKLELPGADQYLQDHMTAGVVCQTPLETAGNIYHSLSDFSKTLEFQPFIYDAVAFVNNSALARFTNNSATFQATVQAALDDSTSGLMPTPYPEVMQGYKARKVFDHLLGFAKFSEFLVVAERCSLELEVSLDGIHFATGKFPPSMHPETQHVNILLFLSAPAPFWGNILKSNPNGTYFGLENVNRDEQGCVDFEKMIGLDGIALFNVVSNPTDATLSGHKQLQSRLISPWTRERSS